MAIGEIEPKAEMVTAHATPDMLIFDAETARGIRESRVAMGIDRWDEVWDGVYVIMPNPNIEHQKIVSKLLIALDSCFRPEEAADVLIPVNVSDRQEGWTSNFRGPDVSVFLEDGAGRNCGTHWVGGPDLAVEILSDNDPTYEKLNFYAKNGVRELLVIDRRPWSIELYRLAAGSLKLAGTSSIETSETLTSEVIPARFRLVAGEKRPMVEVGSTRDDRRWLA